MIPKISIIVPVYKAEARLSLCVESILNQTFCDFELILVDDGSPDKSGEICDSFANKDRRVVVIHKKNGGVSSARNSGLNNSRGEWIVFVDSDDTINRDFLEENYNLVQASTADMCISGLIMETWDSGQIIDAQVYDGKDNVYTAKELLDSKDIDYPTICVSGPWCKFYRTSIINDFHLRFDETMALGEDTCFVYSFFEHANNIIFNKKCYYHYYRGNGESLFSRYHSDFFELYSKNIEKKLSTMNLLGCSQGALLREKNILAYLLMDSVKKEYQFFENSSKQKRRITMKKVANHPLIKQCKVRDYAQGFELPMFAAVRYKMYTIADLLFKFKFKLRKLI